MPHLLLLPPDAPTPCLPAPSAHPRPQSGCSLTCPWCSLSCSCTCNRGAGHGSSVSRCSHGARLHTRPQEGRTGRPRRRQDAHTSALARHRASLGVSASPTDPGPCSYFLSSTSEAAPSTPPSCEPAPHPISEPFSPSRGPLSPPSKQRPPPSWPLQAHQPQWGRRRHRAHWVA